MNPQEGKSFVCLMNISDLICEVVNQYYKAYNKGVTKTKLLKLVYLVEVTYKRRYSEKLTNTEWIYYLYGPYLQGYDELLQNQNIIIHKTLIHDENEAQIVSLKNDYNMKNILPEIKYLISSIVRDYGKLELNDLLDHVYFETEPMMNAENRGEKLDFGSVMPEKYYKIRKSKIDKKQKKLLRDDFKKRLEVIRGKRNS